MALALAREQEQAQAQAPAQARQQAQFTATFPWLSFFAFVLVGLTLGLLAVSSFATLRDSFDGDSVTSADAAKAATAGGALLVARGAALGGGYVLLDKRLEAGKKECTRLGIDYSDLYVQASDIPAQIPWWNAYAGPFKMAEVGETKLSSSATWGRMRSRLKEHAFREACVAQGVQCDDVDQSFSKDENKRWVEMRRRLQAAGKEVPDFSTNGLF